MIAIQEGHAQILEYLSKFTKKKTNAQLVGNALIKLEVQFFPVINSL